MAAFPQLLSRSIDTDPNYGAPRISPGRSAAVYNRQVSPRMTTIDGPNGVTTRTTEPLNYNADPPQEIGNATVNLGFEKPVQMSLDRAIGMRNGGTLGRMPSPQSYLGHAMTTGMTSPNQPLPGAAPQMSNFASGGSPVPTSPSALLHPQSTGLSPQRQKQLNAEYAQLSRYSSDHLKSSGAKDTDEIYTGWQTRLKAIREGRDPDVPIAPFAESMSKAMNALNFSPAPSPQMPNSQNSPAPTPLDPAERARRIQIMEDASARDLDANPTLGTQPVPAEATMPLVPTPTQAGQAVRAGPDATATNNAATLRMANAGRNKTIAQNEVQMDQNKIASDALARRAAARHPESQPTTQPPAQAGGQQAQVIPQHAIDHLKSLGGQVGEDGTATLAGRKLQYIADENGGKFRVVR